MGRLIEQAFVWAWFITISLSISGLMLTGLYIIVSAPIFLAAVKAISVIITVTICVTLAAITAVILTENFK